MLMAMPRVMPGGLSLVEKTDGSRLAVGRLLAGLAAVAVEVVDGDVVELAQQPLAHDDCRRVAQPGRVGDEADDALAGLLGDAPLGDAEEADVEVVELVLGDVPLVGQAVLVGLDEAAFLAAGDAGEAVVGRVAEHDEDGLAALDGLGGVALGLELGERQRRCSSRSAQPVSAFVK